MKRVAARVSPLLVGAAAVVAVALPGGASASPQGAPRANPDTAPTVASVTKQLDRLAQRTEVLTEQYNGTLVQIRRQEAAIAAAKRQVREAQARYDGARRQFAVIAAAHYQGSAFSSTGAILSSRSGDSYLDALATQQLVAAHSAEVLSELDAAQTDGAKAQKTASRLLAEARAARAGLGEKRAQVEAKTAQMRALLSGLTAAERAAYSSRGAPTPAEISAALAEPAPSQKARTAVDFAVAQVGKPYVWAAAGPDAFDCSGLTMAAWAQAGVPLPHFSAAQYQLGRHVSYDALEPGDLVFLYSDIHHVEMYIGNGLVVSAPQEGEPVKIEYLSVGRNVFAGATRLG